MAGIPACLLHRIGLRQKRKGWFGLGGRASICPEAAPTNSPRGLPLSSVREIMRGLLAGVAYLHSQGVVHRDVKPENVMLDHAHGVKLAGFSCGELCIFIACGSLRSLGGPLGFLGGPLAPWGPIRVPWGPLKDPTRPSDPERISGLACHLYHLPASNCFPAHGQSARSKSPCPAASSCRVSRVSVASLAAW